MPSFRALFVVLVASLAGCLPARHGLLDKTCDSTPECGADLTCVQGRCGYPEAPAPEQPTPEEPAPQNRWASVPSISGARAYHSGTLLSDGRVFVAGGGGALSTASLFRPDPEGFAASNPLLAGRGGHTATRLPDGTVLLAGGRSGAGQPLTSVERFDPATGNFSAASPLLVAAEDHFATLTSTGEVLLFGAASERRVQRWGPTPGAWRFGAASSHYYVSSAVVALPDGRVLGINGKGVEAYFPQEDRWEVHSVEFRSNYNHTATVLSDGRVLVLGGTLGGASPAALRQASLYLPDEKRWQSLPQMAEAREDHTATLLTDGRVLVCGGFAGEKPTRSAELFDPKTLTFVPAASMARSRSGHTATRLSDGSVLVVGGLTEGGASTAEAERYFP